jgi:hypothetical protein
MAAIAETFLILYSQLSDTDFRAGVLASRRLSTSPGATTKQPVGRPSPRMVRPPRRPQQDDTGFKRSGHDSPYDGANHFADLMTNALTAGR